MRLARPGGHGATMALDDLEHDGPNACPISGAAPEGHEPLDERAKAGTLDARQVTPC
jgi:hypothetical protein